MIRTTKLEFLSKMHTSDNVLPACHVSCVMSYVVCRVSCVMCRVSCVMCRSVDNFQVFKILRAFSNDSEMVLWSGDKSLHSPSLMRSVSLCGSM